MVVSELIRDFPTLLASAGSETSRALSDWWENFGALEKTGMILLGGILVHVIFRMFILRGLNKVARATENDLDDRLVHFIRRFYALGLLFALVMLILRANNIEITPLLASAGIMGRSQE